MVATLAQAQVDLEPYIVRLNACVQRAIREFMAEQAAHLYKLETRTQAGILRDYIVSNIRAEFPEDEPGIRHQKFANLYLLTIHNRYFLRFKKLDRRLRTRNNPTQLSLDYLLQQPMLLFPSLEPATNLNVGYQPGMTLASSSVWITCPDGAVLDWKWQISESTEPTQLVAGPTGPTPKPVPIRTPAKRVRPKQKPAKRVDGSVK